MADVDHSDFDDVLVSVAIEDLERPHIVVCRTRSGAVTAVSGPYATGVAALVAADWEHHLERASGHRPEVVFSVAALYPAMTVGP